MSIRRQLLDKGDGWRYVTPDKTFLAYAHSDRYTLYDSTKREPIGVFTTLRDVECAIYAALAERTRAS